MIKYKTKIFNKYLGKMVGSISLPFKLLIECECSLIKVAYFDLLVSFSGYGSWLTLFLTLDVSEADFLSLEQDVRPLKLLLFDLSLTSLLILLWWPLSEQFKLTIEITLRSWQTNNPAISMWDTEPFICKYIFRINIGRISKNKNYEKVWSTKIPQKEVTTL